MLRLVARCSTNLRAVGTNPSVTSVGGMFHSRAPLPRIYVQHQTSSVANY